MMSQYYYGYILFSHSVHLHLVLVTLKIIQLRGNIKSEDLNKAVSRSQTSSLIIQKIISFMSFMTHHMSEHRVSYETALLQLQRH